MQSKYQMENNLLCYGSKFTEPFRDDLALAIGSVLHSPIYLNDLAVPELVQAVLGDACGQRFLGALRLMYRRIYRNDAAECSVNRNI